jgi:nucleotide-binding universal stress UspA family protein
MTAFKLDADEHIIAAVDATDRALDALELVKLLGQSTGAPVDVVSVFPYLALADPAGEELVRVREEARTILRPLANASDLKAAGVEVIPGNLPARELQRLSEQDSTGVIVVGSTHRGAVGRVLPGAVGERLLTGAACPVAAAPRGTRTCGPPVSNGWASPSTAQRRRAVRSSSPAGLCRRPVRTYASSPCSNQ